MDMIKVESGNIAEIGWDKTNIDTRIGDLDVKFKSGSLYRYRDVPEEKYFGFKEALSMGKYFQANIKEEYDCFKIVMVEKEGKLVETEVPVVPKEPKR